MKHRIYIDEVGNSDLQSSDDPNHRYLSLTGVIFDLNYVRTVAHELETFKSRYFSNHPDDPVILHRKELVNKKFPFKALRNQEIEQAFNEELLGFLTSWEYTVITVTIDKKEHLDRYASWRHDAYHYCMAVLLERYYRFLTDLNDVGDVLIESRGRREDMRLKKAYTELYQKGTPYIRGEYLRRVLTSRQLKVKTKSANVAGLQIADLVAYASRRHALKRYANLDDGRETFNERIIEILKSKYLKKVQRIDGWGMKWLP